MKIQPQYIGSTRRGLGEWFAQRVSAVVAAAFGLYFLVALCLAPPTDLETWRAWVLGGGMRLALGLFFAATLIHAWIGMRSVFLDYLKPMSLRLVVSTATGLGLAVIALWVAALLLGAV
ncbi:MAG: succinate dehydrogenase, hydrophobic membrane anchor protein [Gammaproteobacteria bacterium]|nr:succinate dehydrogenase, hydrophobic membrane anchor protein [Gammaproteobacteria bacterium]